DPIQQIFEQYRGAGSSPDKTADCADAGVQAIRHGDNHDQRHRIGGKDQESSVQDRKAGEPIGDSVGNLGGCSGRLSEATELPTSIIFQPENLHQIRNIYLNEVDKMLERAKEATQNPQWTYVEYARFADDMVILVD